ncbi:MAG: hypothetical protein CL909_09655, partial [Deltaproteobacteria bacterium]|nr:hypothetical protein [Deltaproteobacteria bacterium]
MLSPSFSVPAAPVIFICLPVGRSKACSIVNVFPFAKLISENSVWVKLFITPLLLILMRGALEASPE